MCASKMKESFMDLEWHKSNQITEFLIFGWTIPLNLI